MYVPAENAAAIPAHASVDLTAALRTHRAVRGAARRGEGGGPGTAQSAQSISAFLGDSQLGEQFTPGGRPVAVLVELDRSASTQERLPLVHRRRAPRSRLDSMTLATGSVRLADQRPVDWLLP